LSVVEGNVVLAHEYIAHDPQRSVGGWYVNASEREQAHWAGLDYVVFTLKSEVFSTESDGQFWKAGDLLAVNGVLFWVQEEWFGTCSGGKGFDIGRWACQDGRSGIKDDFGARGDALSVQFHAVKLGFPVGLAGKVNVGQVTSVVVWVGSAEGKFTVGSARAGQVESKYGLVNNVLFNGTAEYGGQVINGDALERKPKDTVELSNRVGKSKSFGVVDHGEVLPFNGEGTNLNVVLAYNATYWATSVADIKDATVSLEGATFGRVEFRVRAAAGAVFGWDPQVAGTGVKDDLELLATNGRWAVVLGILEVVKGNWVSGRQAVLGGNVARHVVVTVFVGDLTQTLVLGQRNSVQGSGRADERNQKQDS